jgi:hypothetical protein
MLRDGAATPRWRFLHCSLLLFLFACGCASTVNDGREWVRPVYQERIREWQMRIRQEGWSENGVHDLLLQFRSLAAYRVEIRDHWDTPADFIEQRFSGDCKNIAVFEMGVLKQLSYPYGVRILIVHALFEDHALLKVEMPEGGWRIFDVASENVPMLRPGLLRPVAEFDEKRVSWYPPQTNAPRDPRRSDAGAAPSGDASGF